MIPRPRPNDNTGVPGTVYVLHFHPPYLHAGHYAAGLPATSMRASPRTCTGRGHRSRARPSRPAPTSRLSRRSPAHARSSAAERWHKTAQFLPYTRRWVAANALRRSSLGTWDRLIL